MAVDSQSLNKFENERGSTLPLLIGLLLFCTSLYMICVDIYVLKEKRLSLESTGEQLLSNAYQNLDYDHYFFDRPRKSVEKTEDFVAFDCSELITNVKSLSKYLDPKITIVTLECDFSILRIMLSEEVVIPFNLPVFRGYRPQVLAYVSGGVQRLVQ